MGPLDHDLGLKAGFPNPHTRPKDAISAYNFFIRVRVRVRVRVTKLVYQIGFTTPF